MLKRLLHVIALLAVVILIAYIIKILQPVPFPDAEGIGKIDPEAPVRYSITENGIQYRILRKGTGKIPKDTDTVIFRMRQELPSGEEVTDNLYGKTRSIYQVQLGPLPGIRTILPMIREGGLIEAVLPPSQAYGKRGHRAAKTPNNSAIHLVLALDEVQDRFEATEPGKPDDDAPTEYTQTKSGLKYKILRKSDGPKYNPDEGKIMVIHFTISLKDGTKVDSTYDKGFAIETTFDSTVQDWPTGFREGIQLIGVGGMIDMEISPELGFGDIPQVGIPPNSTIHMIVELMDIRKNREESTKPL